MFSKRKSASFLPHGNLVLNQRNLDDFSLSLAVLATVDRDRLVDCSDDEAMMCDDEDLRKVEFARRGHSPGSNNRVRDDSAEKMSSKLDKYWVIECLFLPVAVDEVHLGSDELMCDGTAVESMAVESRQTDECLGHVDSTTSYSIFHRCLLSDQCKLDFRWLSPVRRHDSLDAPLRENTFWNFLSIHDFRSKVN